MFDVEYREIEKICFKIKKIFGKDIDYKKIATNIVELEKIIFYIESLQYYVDIDQIKEIEKVQLYIWNLYYQMTGLKHQHDLFDNIWKLSLRKQEQKIIEIANDRKYNNLYFADISKFNKSYFSDAAQVIIRRGYPKVEDVIPELFVWLQDINWPGSYDIFEFLCSFPKEAILKYFEETVKKAVETKDEVWLYQLQQLMYHFELTENDFKDKKLYEALNQEIDY